MPLMTIAALFALVQVAQQGAGVVGAVEAVSYTHLDVYKRQDSTWIMVLPYTAFSMMETRCQRLLRDMGRNSTILTLSPMPHSFMGS